MILLLDQGGKAMLQRKELLLLVVGILAGAVAGLVVGYGIHGTPAQGDTGSLQSSGDMLGIDSNRTNQTDFGLQQTPLTLADHSIFALISAMNARNEQLMTYNQQLAQLRAQLTNISKSDYPQEYANLTQQIEDLEGLIDSLNSDLQRDMVQLQALIDARKQNSVTSDNNRHFEEFLDDSTKKRWGDNDAGQMD